MRIRIAGLLILAGLLAVGAFAQNGVRTPSDEQMANVYSQSIISARAGYVNYTHGKVTLPLGNDMKPNRQMQEGQSLTTQNGGRAEVLLTPGAYLRLDGNSEVRMVSTKLTDPVVELVRGTESIEVGESRRSTPVVTVVWHDQRIPLANTGLYRFEPNTDSVRVYVLSGKLRMPGDKGDLKSGRYIDLSSTGTLSASSKFNVNDLDDFDRFSRRRAESLAVASSRAAYAIRGGFYGDGFLTSAFLDPYWRTGRTGFWMYDPWSYGYTWIPYNYSVCSPWGYYYYAPRAYTVPKGGIGNVGGTSAIVSNSPATNPPRVAVPNRGIATGSSGMLPPRIAPPSSAALPPRFVPPSSMPGTMRPSSPSVRSDGIFTRGTGGSSSGGGFAPASATHAPSSSGTAPAPAAAPSSGGDSRPSPRIGH